MTIHRKPSRKERKVMERMKGFLAVAGLLLFTGLGMGTNASGETGRPCADDIQQFCKEIKPGAGGIEKCLREHEGDLSTACKERRAAMKKKVEEKQQACREDVQKFCKDVQPGRGGTGRCLREHESELSSECRAALPEARMRK